MSMTILISLVLASAAQQADDPVAACRAAHGGDPTAHIACLEQALRKRDSHAADDKPETGKPTELGAEQVRGAEPPPLAEEQSVSVRIISATYDAEGRGIFRMESGQVWHETQVSPASKRLKPDRQYLARIERGWPSGYRMHVEGVRGMIKLRRIR